MSNTISVLQKRELLGHEFTIYGTSDEPLFLAKDVAELIEHSKVSMMLQSIDEDEKGIYKVYLTSSEVNKVYPTSKARDTQEMWFLTEDGLYEVLMRSNKPIAKQFKKGVKEILKEIRKTGGYIATTTEESEEDIMAKAHEIMLRTLARREERIAQLEAEKEAHSIKVCNLENRIELQNEEIKKSAPKVDYYNEVLQSKSTLTTTQIAKAMGMEANALNKKLKELGIQYKQSGQWMLCAPYSSWGIHTTRTQTYYTADGSIGSKIYTVWTQRGRRFLVALYNCDWSVKDAIQLINGQIKKEKEDEFGGMMLQIAQ